MPSSIVTWPFWPSMRSCRCSWSSGVVTWRSWGLLCGGDVESQEVAVLSQVSSTPLMSLGLLLPVAVMGPAACMPAPLVSVPCPSCSLPVPLVPLPCLWSPCGVRQCEAGGGTWSEPGHGDGGWWVLGGKNNVTWHRCDMLSRGLGVANTHIRCQMWQLL